MKRAGPTTPTPEYADTWLDRQLLRQFHRRVAAELGDDPNTATGDYDETMRRCVKLVSSAPTAAEAQARGERVLRALLPPGFPAIFRKFIALFPGWFTARHAAAVTPLILPWLVGPARVVDAPDDLPVDDDARPPPNAAVAALMKFGSNDDNNNENDNPTTATMTKAEAEAAYARANGNLAELFRVAGGLGIAVVGGGGETPGYKQGVLLERCRVLEEGGCASVCLNVCKLPTQQFFNEEIGLPVTLEPNYETFECQFVYGKTPPPPELDKAFNTPCFGQCPITKMGGGGGVMSKSAATSSSAEGVGDAASGTTTTSTTTTTTAVVAAAAAGGGTPSALGEVPRWIVSDQPIDSAASVEEDDSAAGIATTSLVDGSGIFEDDAEKRKRKIIVNGGVGGGAARPSNCSRLPVYVGEEEEAGDDDDEEEEVVEEGCDVDGSEPRVVRRNHPRAGDVSGPR